MVDLLAGVQLHPPAGALHLLAAVGLAPVQPCEVPVLGLVLGS